MSITDNPLSILIGLVVVSLLFSAIGITAMCNMLQTIINLLAQKGPDETTSPRSDD